MRRTLAVRTIAALIIVGSLMWACNAHAARMTTADWHARLAMQDRAFRQARTAVAWWDRHASRFILRYPAPPAARAAGRAQFARARLRWVTRERAETLAVIRQRAFLELPATRDWLTATRIAERVWPQHGRWLRACSSSEGGWGGWVTNRQGSGAGGWLQFMHGTFYKYVDGALASAQARGFVIPDQARSWYSPLGQALTGAWMAELHQQHQWAGARC